MTSRHVLTLTVVFAAIAPLRAETRVNYGLGGVRMQVGRVHMNLRSGGRLTTSIPVGRTWIHQSNHGVSGLTYDSPVGRIDSMTNQRSRRSFAWYTARPPSRTPTRVDWKLRNVRPDVPAWTYSVGTVPRSTFLPTQPLVLYQR